MFLTASVEARAERRYKECLQKKEDTTLEKVRADLEQRDWQDTHRTEAPLRRADDAVLLDTSAMDFEESYQALLDTVRRGAGI